MHRSRISPALLVAALALVVAVSGGTAAVAATLITGKQIKDRSIGAVDIAKNALTGTEINEGTLGPVPRAVTSDKLAGIASTGYLRSTRIESGTIDFIALTAGQLGTLFTDPRLELRVSYQAPARLFLQNLSTTNSIKVAGIGFFGGTANPTQVTIAPGQSTSIIYDATGFEYGSFLVTSRRTPASASPVLQLTCAMDDGPSQTAFSCTGVG